MIRLETVEDFEKVKKALEDPASKPHQYCVKNFGYCTACKTITEYEEKYPMFSNCSISCLRCKRFFDASHHVPIPDVFLSFDGHYYYINSAQIPGEMRDQFDKLHSREFQLRAFRYKLDEYKKNIKSKIRKLNSQVRRLAKLGS